MLTVIQLSGPINSGKSSIGQALARHLPDASFIDGDDHGAPDDASLAERIAAAWRRIAAHIATTTDAYLIVAYPVDFASYQQLKAECERRSARLLLITLAPPIETALADRGERKLTDWERQRVAEMYREGFHAWDFSDIIFDTAGHTATENAALLAARIARTG